MARKFAAEPRSDRLVLSTCADEKYAVVTNVWRRPLPRRLRLRAECSASSARSSADATAAERRSRGLPLVGLRDYEAPNHRLCDLLEVYSRTTACTSRALHNAGTMRCRAQPSHGAGRARRGGSGLSSAHVVFSNAAQTGRGSGSGGLAGGGLSGAYTAHDFDIDDI
jgi:hypothetical protein